MTAAARAACLARVFSRAVRFGAGSAVDYKLGFTKTRERVMDEVEARFEYDGADDVSILQSVTLGGNGKESGDRHPKIGRGVMIGAGAKVLGNIRVGARSRIAAGSVVLMDVPPCKTVAGVPARIVGDAGCDQPSDMMNQILGLDSVF